MQAPSNSSTIQLTTKSSTTVTPTPGIYQQQQQQQQRQQHNSATLTTSNDSIKITKSTKTTQGKKPSSSFVDQSCASKEIEEISKKISEHADAIYRTWKSRGLAPTEILDIYANAATVAANVDQQHQQRSVPIEAIDIFGGSVEAAVNTTTPTEGLQKLVSQFVIKDKEQRGVKSTYGAGGINIGGGAGLGVLSLHKSQRPTETTSATSTTSSLADDRIAAGIMPENIGNKMTQKTGVIGGGGGSGGALKQYTLKTSGIQQKPTSTAAASVISLKSAKSHENSSGKKLAKSSGATTPAATTTSSAKTTSSTRASSPSPSLSTSSPKASSLTAAPSSSLSVTTTATATATPIKNNACVKNVNSAQQRTNNNNSSNNNNISILANKHSTPTTPTSVSPPSTAKATTTAAKSAATTKRTLAKGAAAAAAPTLDINLNLDLGFDAIQLDVNSLSHLQTQNLLKIKELLQENNPPTSQQEPKKATTTKVTTKVKRPKSPAKLLLESTTTVTDSPIVTKTKITKLLNENEQLNNNNNTITTVTHHSVKKAAKNANNNNNTKSNNNIKPISVSSVSDKSNNSIGSNVIGETINDDASGIGKLIVNTSDLSSTSGKTIAPTTPSKIKSITTKSTIAKASSPTTTTTTAAAATINGAKIATLAAAATPPLANVVSSVKTVDHQSINKALDSNIGDGTSSGSGGGGGAKKQSQALGDNAAQRSTTSAQKSSAITTSTGKAKAPKSVKSGNSSKAAAAAASSTAEEQQQQPVMEIAPSGNNKVNGNGNGNAHSSINSNTSSSSMPAPTKLSSGRPASTQDKPVNRPFLTRGSVAERVLMFEKCPGVRNSFLNIKRPDLDVLPKSLRKVSIKLHATPPGNQQQSEQNSLQREIRTTRSVYIPRFYFPHGKPQPQIAQERTIRGILAAFDTFPNNQVTKDELPKILKICGLPLYWRMPVVVFCQQNNNGLVERSRFLEFWKQMNIYCHDAASRFVYIHSRGQRFRSYIAPEDLVPLVQDVVDTHPGLAFLKEATEFHSRYVHTVIARIFYSVNRCWSGKITISELKKSDLLEIITLLEEEDDINQIMAFFSYEHFYVIYCKFWELDKDHDLLISQDDLARHSDHALSSRIVERIFSGCVTRTDNRKHPDDEPKMSYTDFVWFLLSEEDKRTPTAIEYWFRCMDLDGDGLLSMYELEYFYEEQQQRMESIGIETLPFEDCLCQMLDMIKPQQHDAISLGDLKRCKMTHVFFDTFFNLEKYLDHEQRDPFATQRDEYASDWDRFAAHEYELLISEENG